MINNIIKKANVFYKLAVKDLADRMLELGEIKILEAPLTVSHRSSNLNLTQKDLDPLAIRKTRQGKSESNPMVGLYTYDIENDVPRYGENKIDIELPAGTKILDVVNVENFYSTKIPKYVAERLILEGIDVIKGKDIIGPPEYIILKMPK